MKSNKWTFISIFLTPILLFIAFLFMGGGHGTYKPAILFFPYGMLIVQFFNKINFFSIFISTFQYLIYGLIIDYYVVNKSKKLLIGVILGHIFLSILLLNIMVKWK